MRADTPYKAIEDVRKASTAPKCGATDISSAGYYIPKIIDETLGTKFDIVSGYPSGQDIDLAVERGELQCRAFTITAYFAREPFISWRKRNFTSVLIQTGSKRDGRIKESPTIYELMDKYKTNENGRKLAKVILASGDFGRPIVAGPGVPPDRIKILRDSFDKTIADPAFMLLGIIIGFWVGLLPGIGGLSTLALMLPFSYSIKDPISAFAFLLGMSWSSAIQIVLSVWHRCRCKIRRAPPKCWSAPYVI